MRGNRFLSAVALACIILTGCASRPKGIEIRTQPVPVVTVEQCIKKEDIPQRPSSLGELPSNLEVVARLALAKVAEWTAYGNQTDKVLKGCATD